MTSKSKLKQQLKPIIKECINEILGEMLIESTLASIVAESVTRVLSEGIEGISVKQPIQHKPKICDEVGNEFERNFAKFSGRLDQQTINETPEPRPVMDFNGIDVFADIGAPISAGSPENLMVESMPAGESADISALGLDFNAMRRAAGIEDITPTPRSSNILEEQRLAQLRASLDVPADSPHAQSIMQQQLTKAQRGIR